MYVVMSKGISYFIPSGKVLLMFSIVSFTFSATSIALAPGNIYTPRTAALPPLMPLSVLYDCASSDTRATSRRRMNEPSALARSTISSNWAADDSRPCAVIGIVKSSPFTGCWPSTPAADSRFWSLRAFCTSCTVSPKLARRDGSTHICIA